ncbi:hypothetical protein [Streptomyces sp. NPDC046988]
MLNLAIDAPARATAHVNGEQATTTADAVTTPTPRPEALPC